MRKLAWGQGAVFFAVIAFVFQLACLSYVYAQDDADEFDGLEGFDDFENSDPAGYTQTAERLEAGEQINAAYVRDLQSNKDYMFYRDGDTGAFKIADATTRQEISPDQAGLHEGNLQVQFAFGQAGQDGAYNNWTDGYVTTLGELQGSLNTPAVPKVGENPAALGDNLSDARLQRPDPASEVSLQKYDNSVQGLRDTRQAEYYSNLPVGLTRADSEDNVDGQGGWRQAIESGAQGRDVAAIQATDRVSGQSYMIYRQDLGNGRFLWNVSDAQTGQVVPQGTAALHDNIQVRVAYGPAGQSEYEWTNPYNVKSVEDLNVFANNGRTDTSNAIRRVESVEQQPLQVSSVRLQPLPDTRTPQEKITQEFNDAVSSNPYRGIDRAIEDVGNTLKRNMIVVEGVNPNDPTGGRTVITGQTNYNGGSDVRVYTPQNGLQFYDPNSGQVSAPSQQHFTTPEPQQPQTFTVVGQDGKPITNPDLLPHSRTKIIIGDDQQ